ncbi:AAA family ATPase [Pseudomonas avellanae]|uniref:AAA family ATPase n=1 Tax=Pseudomonas avellanae TaxID=46257 RepID=UPI000403A917|nr:AAA family ATPase [Pseudomonas avellanae]UQW76258.1 AAA family ATPase [Pseudomonas avellanae]
MKLSMQMLKKSSLIPSDLTDTLLLVGSSWDDYSFKTSFTVMHFGPDAKKTELGTTKIGYKDQQHGWTSEKFSTKNISLSDEFFSLGQDVDFYRKLQGGLSADAALAVLQALKDVIADPERLEDVKNEQVFRESLMRNVSWSVIRDQFKRVLAGKPELTSFHFSYQTNGDEQRAGVDVSFKVTPHSLPSTNVHVLIGRNGVGKTTILNDMVETILSDTTGRPHCGKFLIHDSLGSEPMPTDYFSSIVSVSFSAFDPFLFPADQPDRSKGVAYFYVGMQSPGEGPGKRPPKTTEALSEDFITSLESCFSQESKRQRWVAAIKRLESDSNFEDMDLAHLNELPTDEAIVKAHRIFSRMSSGHSIVLLTLTKLVEAVEEKTLVLMDEPESHLHPPLLSAFTRAISDLLQDRNGVAIIATHSPVVVQEAPGSCVWKLTRLRAEGRADRPERETFGENAGVLTREIFGLEVNKSGYHEVLQEAVNRGGTFESILADYQEQLGFEAQAILRKMVASRRES